MHTPHRLPTRPEPCVTTTPERGIRPHPTIPVRRPLWTQRPCHGPARCHYCVTHPHTSSGETVEVVNRVPGTPWGELPRVISRRREPLTRACAPHRRRADVRGR